MNPSSNKRSLTLPALLCFLALAFATRGQQPPQPPPQNQATDVIRINTELVQTDLMVFDRQGRFVDGLKPEQFELRLAGKPQAISFFERVAAGSDAEAGQLAAARGGGSGAASTKGAKDAAWPDAPDRRRLIFFFLDDVHMSGESLIRARKSLLNYVENQMDQNEQVAIVSTSGQIGFLQQLTDNKTVLAAAIDRLNFKRNSETYAGRTPITEYQANQVLEHGDRALFSYLVSSTINEYQLVIPKGGSPAGLAEVAVNNVRNRARQIEVQSRSVTLNTLKVLESLLRSSAQLPGRKLVFFMSDGFITDARSSTALDMLRRITGMAARSGAIVYTMDTRGTFTDASVDAGRNDFPDGLASGTSAKQPSLETAATREPLIILADATGGRAIFNSNSLEDAVKQALSETSDYYLLAWRPGSEAERNERAKIKVSVKGRPDLTVRLRNSFYTPPPPISADKPESAAAASPAPPRLPEAELLAALGSLYPDKQLPTSVSAGYVNTADSGLALRVSMQIEREAFGFDPEGGTQKREVDVIGAAIDDRGVIKTFKQLVTVTNDPAALRQKIPVIWNQELTLPPGLYQVRVAVRERQTGRTGSAMQWIEVPDLSRGGLRLSSLFLGERRMEEAASAAGSLAPQPIRVDVDHRFARTSVLRFQTYIYNAAARGAASPPDVWIQAQVWRDGRQMVSMPASKVPAEASTDEARLPYWSEISLEQLPAGRYLLLVTATDRATKASATERVHFVIE